MLKKSDGWRTSVFAAIIGCTNFGELIVHPSLRTLAGSLLALTFALSSTAHSAAGGTAIALPSLAPMIKVASPAVVNIATRGTLTERLPRNPLLEDPFFRRFFNVPDRPAVRHRRFQSAGSGVPILRY